MDIRATGEVITVEQARELLIAISYTEPEKVSSPGSVPATADGADDGTAAVNGDGAEKHRSELIAISYEESPDTKKSPAAAAAAFENHDG